MLACAVPASAATSEKADIAQRARCAAAGKAEEAKLLASDGTRMGKEELNAHLAKGGGLKITNGVVDVGGDGTKKHSRIGSN